MNKIAPLNNRYKMALYHLWGLSKKQKEAEFISICYEVRSFLRQYELYQFEFINYRGLVFHTDRYYITCYKSCNIIISDKSGYRIKTNNLNRFKIIIFDYEYNINKSIKIINLYDEVYRLIDIYHTYNKLSYKFIDTRQYWTYNNSFELVNYDPMAAIPHLKTKIDEIEYALYEPSGLEYIHSEQLFYSIVQNE